MPYSASDLIKSLLRARGRGPEAERVWRLRVNAASARYRAGEKIESAFFDLLEDAAASDKSN